MSGRVWKPMLPGLGETKVEPEPVAEVRQAPEPTPPEPVASALRAPEPGVLLGDCLDRMREMPDGHFHAIVTDPPYGLAFMGKDWDKALPPTDVWREALRVLKPGGALLAFGGTRMYHRLACSIEDAGFEIRDCLSWLYGSGFPKSLDVSKAIDKAAGAERERVVNPRWAERYPNGPGGNNTGGDRAATVHQLKSISGNPLEMTLPATDDARTWSGYGTALKPAWEPIILARKPLDGTVAANALEHGCGALNVDGCRIGPGHDGGRGRDGECSADSRYTDRGGTNIAATPGPRGGDPSGRWPANVVLDKPAAAMLDEQSDGASRFFYCAKASKRDRNMGLPPEHPGSRHPTVKPVQLMRWLVRLVSMPSGTRILDPFCGSGSTGVACALEGVEFVGIEREPEHYDVARARIAGVS